MICISIAQGSRRLALVDMLNAAPQCDLIELRLDRFGKAPDVTELLANKPKPVLMSCRRRADGGEWEGPEEERLALLRHCIVSKAEYVEIELDVADQIRPFPPSKRVISYTNFRETPADIVEIYNQACSKRADVVKLATLVRTPEEAWPLVQILRAPAVPTVVVGLGKLGIMLTLLSRKMEAPWAYAALERGMEQYPGQPTIHDLETVYAYRDVHPSNRFIGVTGFDNLQTATVAGLNRAMATLDMPVRCLPLQVGEIAIFRQIMKAVKLVALVVDDEHRQALAGIAAELEAPARHAAAVDALVRHDQDWKGYNLAIRAAIVSLENALRARNPGDQPLAGRTVIVVGASGNARGVAWGIQRQGGILVVASHDRNAAGDIAKTLDCRQVPFEAIYSTLHEVLVICADREPAGVRVPRTPLQPTYLKPGMTVMDLTAPGTKSDFLRGAEEHGATIVSPREVLLDHLTLQVKLLAKMDVDRRVLEEAIAPFCGEDEEEQERRLPSR